jgi:hypothetical protein
MYCRRPSIQCSVDYKVLVTVQVDGNQILLTYMHGIDLSRGLLELSVIRVMIEGDVVAQCFLCMNEPKYALGCYKDIEWSSPSSGGDETCSKPPSYHQSHLLIVLKSFSIVVVCLLIHEDYSLRFQ